MLCERKSHPGLCIDCSQLLFFRRDEALIPSRELGVMFQDLHVTGLGASNSYAHTIASILNPVNLIKQVQNLRKSTVRDILSGFEGTVKPGEMLRE